MPHLARRSSAFPHMTAMMPNCARSPGKFEGSGLRYVGNDEPKVSDVMSDPLVARLLASDGVAKEDLATLVERVRHQLEA